MNIDRQRQIRAVFDAVVSLPRETQVDFVRRKAGGDPEVEQSVLRLLRAARSSEKFLQNPLVERHDLNALRGTRLGAYLVDRQIGAGGMGVVYLAMRADDAYKRVSALKILRPEFHAPDRIERFRRERQILAQLDHPNIARIIDGGTTPAGLPYFVMDYIDGQPIDHFCNERKAALNQRLNLFRQACMAVQYLHENKIVHRDLKPANMLVTKGGTVKLLDFGIAKLLQDEGAARATSTRIATPEYASPEQLDSKPTGPATDIYSLGVILYELLTGRRPHDDAGQSLPSAIRAITSDDIRKPSATVGSSATLRTRDALPELRKRLRGDLDSILLMALRREPAARYGSVAEFAQDVENFQQGRAVLARKGASLYGVSHFAKRHGGRVAAVAVLLVALSWLGMDEWRLHRLSASTVTAQTPSSLVSAIDTPQGVANARQSIQRLGRNYKTTFPEILDNPLSRRKDNEALVQRDLEWLNQTEPVVQRKPELASDIGRAYLNIAEAQWSENQPSLKDAAASQSTCRKAIDLLQKLPKDLVNSDAVKKLRDDLQQQFDKPSPSSQPG